MITLDDDKVKTLKEIFWDMNEISSSVNYEMVDEEYTEDGETKIRQVEKNILHIKITSKNTDEMIQKYNFNDKE